MSSPSSSSGREVAPATPGRAVTDRELPVADAGPSDADPRPRVWVDQDLCTGDGICAQLAPEVFKIHWDGLAYVHGGDEQVLETPGATVPVDPEVAAEVLESARECPGDCICVVPGPDGSVHGDAPPREVPGEEAS